MNKIQFLIALISLTFFSANVYAEEVVASEAKQADAQEQMSQPAEFQKVVDEYKAYVAKIPTEIREEIVAYRKKVAEINKEKRVLYKKLSQASQDYLKKEQQYKKKLPLNRKNLINVEAPGEAPQKEKDSAIK